MIALDFFCGSGGMTRGLRSAGIDVLSGIDSDDTCRSDYEHNNPGSTFVHRDIRQLSREDISRLVCAQDGGAALLFAGCAPCQPFSTHQRTDRRGPNAVVLGSFGALVEAVLPETVLIENVPGIARVGGFSTFRRFLRTLERNKYSVAWSVLDARDYGVPQTRRRVVLLATLGCVASLPDATHGPGLIPYRTVRDAIAHYPALDAGECSPIDTNHRAAGLSDLNLQRIRRTPEDGGSHSDWPDSLTLECHRNTKGHSDSYGRLAWNRPAPTLTGRCHSLSNGRYGHPSQNRALSLREAAALQSFPDDYVFAGPMATVAQHIGNAVPVRLAEVLGQHVVALRSTARCPSPKKAIALHR